MFKIKINLPFDISGEIWLDTERLEASADLKWDDSIDSYVRDLLSTGYGFRGGISEVTCPLDLNKAIKDSGVDLEIVEGADILNQEIQPVVEGRFY